MTLTASPSSPSGIVTGVLFGLAAALIWGAWPVVSRFGVQQTLTSYDIVALRFAVSGLVLLPFFLRSGCGAIGWGRTAVLSLGAGAPYALAAIVGLTFAPAGHAGVIIPSCMLTTSMLGAWWLLGERPDRVRLVGAAIILLGVLITGWRGLAVGGEGTWIGDLLFVVAGMLWALYTVASRAWSVDAFRATCVVSVVSMVLYTPFYLGLADSKLGAAPWQEIVFQGAFQGIGTAILALVFYTRAVGALGAARGSVFAALVPAVVVLLAIPVLGEVPGLFECAGIAIVSAGMIVTLRLYAILPLKR
jgi:drug/metabolite transporter (DMT)-like permease